MTVLTYSSTPNATFVKAALLFSFAICLMTGTSRIAHARLIHVPKEHATIQAGIEAASAGDTVVVAAGTYKERIRLKVGITVKSAGDDTKGKLGLLRAEKTIIDGGGLSTERLNGAGVSMEEHAVLDGFSITNVGQYDDDKWNKHHATNGEHQEHEHIGAAGTAGIDITGVTCTVKHNIVHYIGYTGIAITGFKGKRT
ncbi:DUF1565 domain-containing protein, partial [Planctomycetota bacterium]